MDVFAGSDVLGQAQPSLDSPGLSVGAPPVGTPIDDSDFPLRPLVEAWRTKIKLAIDHKQVKFTKTAEEVMKFLRGGQVLNEHLWGGKGAKGVLNETTDDGEDMAPPRWRFTLNKVAEVLQLFAPTLYYNNPIRIVTPRKLEPVPAEVYTLLGMNPGPQPPAAELWQTPPMAMQMMQAQQMAQMGNPQMAMGLQQQMAPMQMQAQMQAQITGQDDHAMKVMSDTRAALFTDYLNWTPEALDLKTNSRRVIDECLLKGMGVWWTEIYQPAGHQVKLVGSFYDTVDNLLLDPDVQQIEECTWVARKCTHPMWEVEQTYNLPAGSLKQALSAMESVAQQSELSADKEASDKRMRGTTNDLVTYWKIYSKMGLGGRMAGMDKDLVAQFDGYGDNCFLVICPGINYPLNLPNGLVKAKPDPAQDFDGSQTAGWNKQMMQAVQWPIPFWAANNGWPFTHLAFHDVPNNVWPMSHIAPGLGELKWMNACFSWLASKVKSSCGTLIAVAKGFDPQEKKKLLDTSDQRVVEYGSEWGENMDMRKIIQYVQQPDFHKDIYEVLDRTSEAFDKRIGLTEILYGMSGNAQSRSATDSQIKQQNSSIRLRDMANKVEDSMAAVARKEAFAARWMLDQEDVVPIVGRDRAMLWGQLVQSSDVELVTLELDYRIEAGSTQKPDNQQKIDQMNAAVQTWAPLLTQIAEQWQQVGPINALMSQWCKANEIDPTPFLIQQPPPPMPPMPQAPPGQPGPGPQQRPQQPPPQQPAQPPRHAA